MLIFSNSLFALPAGTLDSSFSDDGLVTTAAGASFSVAEDLIQQQNDLKLVAVGRSNDGVGAFDRFAAVRYSSNGIVDTNFGGDGIVNTTVGSGNAGAFAVTQQANGKLVVVGLALNSNAQPTSDFAVVRYNANGSLDTNFNNGGIVLTPPHSRVDLDVFEDGAQAVVETPEHKLVVAGFSGTATDSDFALVRYNSDGSLDTSFSPIGEPGKVTTDFGNMRNDVVFSMIQQADGKLFVAGFSNNAATNTDDFAVARYNADGTLDKGFNSNGLKRTSISSGDDQGLSVIQLTVEGPDKDKYVVAGYSTTSGNEDIALVRYNQNGSLDTTFSGDGIVRTPIGSGNDRAYQVMELPNGKLLVAGYTQVGINDFDFVLVRYNQNGSLDTSFSGDGKLSTSFGAGSDQAFAAVQQANDYRIVLAGAASITTNLVSQKRLALARYLPGDLDNDGVLDYIDNCPNTKNEDQADQDKDGIGDVCDDDRDGDGHLNKEDAFPDDPTEWNDNDGDGIGDNADPDDDNDGVPDEDDPFPFDANLLNQFSGEKKSDYLGYSVANAGDIIYTYKDIDNKVIVGFGKDGFDDVIVGVPRFDKKEGKKTLSNAGSVYVYSGNFADQAKRIEFTGSAAGDQFGSAVAGGGDVNGDLVPDIIVGAPKADVNIAVDNKNKKLKDAGIAYVFSGADGSELFRIEGESAGDNLGNAASFMKDINTDGWNEIIVGAWKADRVDTSTGKKITDAGAAYVYSYKGSAHALLHKFEGENKGDLFGFSVASTDADQSGKVDAIIGAYGVDTQNSSGKKMKDAGGVYLILLGNGGVGPTLRLGGEHAGDRLGFAVASADVDGDGLADVLAGAPQEDYVQEATQDAPKKTFQDAGSVHVFYGKTLPKFSLYHNKEPQKGALFGSAISDAGVFPSEVGHKFIVGAYKYDPVVKGKKLANTGRVSLHRGCDAEELLTFDGHIQNNYFGFAVSGSSDHNADGFPDMIVGGYQDHSVVDGKKISNAGVVELLTGKYTSVPCSSQP
ncbi:thrombospondin type 3 repeat-containing protein [Methylomicrobium sp. Wu6]|nr:thrombospondin type 3 repeat-containing protein [Methylomicrobium sp. Wu6]